MSETSLKSATRFCSSPLWLEAVWLATTYRTHPSGAAPPVMGFVFADHQMGVRLFQQWTDDWGNHDHDDAIRIAMVEGSIEGQADGYSIHVSSDSSDAGQVKRLHPSPQTEAMFFQFKAQYLTHGEFLLCPVVEKEDGQLWFDAHAGIIKKHIYFRNADDIDENDQDAVVLRPVEAETALHEFMEAVNKQSREISEESDS